MPFYFKTNTVNILAAIFLLFSINSCRQMGKAADDSAIKDSLKTLVANEYASVDQSPLDISYCPADFPQQKMDNTATATLPVARVIYSRPHKKGRVIFSKEKESLCPYGVAWRLGANEATEIEFFKTVVINGKNINAGRYVLYCIPYPDKWVIVLNSNLNSWGLHIDTAKDIYKTEIPVQVQSPVLEDFTITFVQTPTGADMLMAWDNVKTLLPIVYSK